MTEAEWLACEDPTPMLEFFRRRPNNPKFRLFSLACCRAIWCLLTDELLRNGVEMAEKYTEGKGSTQELDSLCRQIEQLEISRRATPWHGWQVMQAVIGVLKSDHLLYRAGIVSNTLTRESVESVNQAGILRDVFGNPFRPVTFSPDWRTDTALTLARQMYDAREFSAMPILADALMDAGCNNDDILNHCRSGGPHVRGCWVCDLVLGKG